MKDFFSKLPKLPKLNLPFKHKQPGGKTPLNQTQLLALAGAFCFLLACVTYFLLPSGEDTAKKQEVPMTQVVVAKQDIPQRTVIKENMLKVVDMPQDAVKLRRDKRVETRERLIEQEQLFGRAECPCEQDALLLSAGELPVAAVGKCSDVEACHLFVGACLVRLCVKGMDRVPVQAAREHNLPHRCRKRPLNHALLRQIADLIAFEPVAKAELSAVRLF